MANYKPLTQEKKKKAAPTFARTEYQQAICEYAVGLATGKHTQHLIVGAGAGTGKTTTIMELVSDILKKSYDSKVLMIAFNDEINQTFSRKLKVIEGGNRVKNFTTHGLGNMLLRTYVQEQYPGFKQATITSYFSHQASSKLVSSLGLGNKKWLGNKVIAAFSSMRDFGLIAKSSEDVKLALKTTPFVELGCESRLQTLMSDLSKAGVRKGMDDILNALLAWNSTLDKAVVSNKDDNILTFTDMCRAPVVHKLFNKTKAWKVPDIVIVDEVQDFNPYQQMFLHEMQRVNPKVRFIMVGDDLQAIYGFRAAVRSFEALEKDLKCKRLTLPETWRSKKKIVKFIKEQIPDSILKATRKGGTILHIDGTPHDPFSTKLAVKNKVNRIVASRNQHLLRCAIHLLQSGHKVSGKGSSAVSELLKFYNRCKRKKPVNLYTFVETALDYCEAIKIKIGDKHTQPTNDELDTFANYANLMYIILVYKLTDFVTLESTLDDIKRSVETEKDPDAMILDTVWSAKGLESHTVMVIDEYFHDNTGQIDNIRNVAYSRASDVLIIQKPPSDFLTKLFKRKEFSFILKSQGKQPGGITTNSGSKLFSRAKRR